MILGQKPQLPYHKVIRKCSKIGFIEIDTVYASTRHGVIVIDYSFLSTVIVIDWTDKNEM